MLRCCCIAWSILSFQVAVHFMGNVAEALLQLPEVPFGRADAAAAAGVPAGLWVTAGLLAADGFALQLRLRKADKVRGGVLVCSLL